jgi:hypothetical protein
VLESTSTMVWIYNYVCIPNFKPDSIKTALFTDALLALATGILGAIANGIGSDIHRNTGTGIGTCSRSSSCNTGIGARFPIQSTGSRDFPARLCSRLSVIGFAALHFVLPIYEYSLDVQ